MFPMYSYKLNKTINVYIRYIRLKLPKRKHVLKSTLLDLFDIKRLVVKRMTEFPNFDSFENIHDVIIATIISLIKVQYNLGYMCENQMTNYIATCLRTSFQN